MEGEGGIGQPQSFGDTTDRKAILSLLYKQAEDGQAVFLSEGSELADGLNCFHVSNYMEMNLCK